MLATSSEFVAKFVQNPNVDRVDAMFQRLLGRAPDPSGKATWQLEMNRVGWFEVVNRILSSDEYQRKFGEDKVPGGGRPGCKCCVETGSQATMQPVPQSDLPQCPIEQSTSPCPKTPAKYRTINGICNNPQHYLWGSAGIPFSRLVPATSPTSANLGFKDYVNSRTISLMMVNEGQSSAVDTRYTALLTWWGQYLSHEVAFSAENGAPCSTLENDFDKCANIDLPPGDVLKATRNSLPVLRTKACTKNGAREQVRFLISAAIFFIKSNQSDLLD